MIHLGNCAAGFDSGSDLPQIGYKIPGTATRVTMAVADLTCDGRPDLVIADRGQNAVMVYRNTSAVSSATCLSAPPSPSRLKRSL
jgi:hypothetical protein